MMRSDFEEIVEPFVRENRRELNARYFTFENFMNAFSLVSSRAFRVDRLHGEAMVPLADLYAIDWFYFLCSFLLAQLQPPYGPRGRPCCR